MMTYLIGAAFTLGILLNAFLHDSSTPKNDLRSWLVLLIATALWVFVVPGLVYKKVFRAGRPAFSTSVS